MDVSALKESPLIPFLCHSFFCEDAKFPCCKHLESNRIYLVWNHFYNGCHLELAKPGSVELKRFQFFQIQSFCKIYFRKMGNVTSLTSCKLLCVKYLGSLKGIISVLYKVFTVHSVGLLTGQRGLGAGIKDPILLLIIIY